MEKATLIILAVLFAVTVFLIFCWVFVAAWYDNIVDFIVKIKPFNAKRKYKKDLREAKRDCKESAKQLKRKIQAERNVLKEYINDSLGYCYADIIYKENIKWLQRKGFNVIRDGLSRYEITWGDNE